MKTFSYKGFDGGGRGARGLVEALSVKDAREKLAGSGILAERVTPTGRRARFRAGQRAMVYRELSALLAAGFPMLRALEVLIDSSELVMERPLLASVRDNIRDGSALADALSAASGSVGEFETAIIDAAERSGSIETMLDNLAGFVEESERIKDRIQNALIYPVIVMTVGICVALVMLGVLVPRAQQLLVSGSVPLPRLTLFTIGLGRVIFYALPLALLGAGLGCGYAWMRRGESEFRKRWSRRLFHVPVLGRGQELLANMRFARTMAALLEGGISVIDGVVLAGRATGNAWIAALAVQQAEKMRHGMRLSDALREIPPLATSLPGAVLVGEASGGLVRVMQGAARRFALRWDQFVTRALALLEPLMILLIGGFVLLVTLSVLLPVIGMSSAVAGG